MTFQHTQKIQVEFDYPVVFTRDLFGIDNPVFRSAFTRLGDAGRKRLMVFVDGGVAATHPDIMDRISSYCRAHRDVLESVREPQVVSGGEGIKTNYRRLMKFVNRLLEFQMCRHSFVVVIGGGAVLDAIGFGVSLVHRGLRIIRVPTTVLSQCDSAVGVKNGMNLRRGKNAIGTFHPPFAVLVDSMFLSTLSFSNWIGGVSEAFKVALIKDAAFFHELCAQAEALRERDIGVMEGVIERCALLHLEHMRGSGDPFELGRARPLDFGHWAAHKLECMTHYQVGHGEAVAIGISLDSLYAAGKGWISRDDVDAILHGLERCGFCLWHDAIARRRGDGRLEILGGLDDFQAHLGGELCIAMPDGVGNKQEVHVMIQEEVETACCRLAERCGVSLSA